MLPLNLLLAGNSVTEPFGFVAAFPAEPVQAEIPAVENDGAAKRVSFTATKGSVLYRVDVLDLKPETLALQDKTLFENAREGTRTLKQFQPSRINFFKFNSFPSQSFEVQVKHGPLMRHQMTLIRPRMFHAVIIGPAEAVRSKASDEFMASLKFIPIATE